MSQGSPLISVVIPAYGVAPFIAETLDSVAAQSYTKWEAIVVNDGSPDTAAMLQAIQPYRHRITYVEQANRGAAAARNAALRIARGEWIAFLDGDDAWLPRFLERQLAVIGERSLDMVWSDGFLFGETGLEGRRLMVESPSSGPVSVASLLSQQVIVLTSATMVRRSLVESAGGFDESLRRAQDFDLWVRLVQAGARADYHHEPLIRYRRRQGSLSGDRLAQIDRALTVFRHLQGRLPFTPLEADILSQGIERLEVHRLQLLGKRHLERSEYADAEARFREANSRVPSAKLRVMLGLLSLVPSFARRLYLALSDKPER